MKKFNPLIIVSLFALMVVSGCQRSSCEVWEDTKTAGRYMGRGLRSLVGQTSDSKQILEADEFIGPSSHDFVALRDEDRALQINLEENAPQSSLTPGETSSGIPSIDGFRDPDTYHTQAVFQNVHFDTNDHIFRGEDNRTIIQNIADYMKDHPSTYLFIEGHCDQRGPAAYNLALGLRRANFVRTQLIQNGVDLNHLFTISYGKEKLLTHEDSPAALAENRRAHFKLYTR